MFQKFPSIEQFRTVIKYVNKYLPEVTTLKYKGTVKLHGTNAAIGVLKDGTVYFQSRNSIITPENDNAGFATFMKHFEIQIRNAFHNPEKDVIEYGEWCGGNIQKGVGINGLNKMFVLFNPIEIPNPVLELPIYSVHDFPTWETEIDFRDPEKIVPYLTEITEAVEAKCPVAAFFNQEGVGEGVVWKPSKLPWADDTSLVFKVKGEKHASSKVKTLIPLTPEQMEQHNKINNFVDYVITPNRVEQAIKEVKAESRKDTGNILKWVMQDVIKEESDTMEQAGITTKEFSAPAIKKIKEIAFTIL